MAEPAFGVTVADGPASSSPPTTAGRGLDPVDLALMQRQQRGPATVNGRRYLTLAVVLVLFVVLLGVGVYLAAHAHAITSGLRHVASGAAALGRGGGGVRLVEGADTAPPASPTADRGVGRRSPGGRNR